MQKIHRTCCFTAIADETGDVSRTEQMAFVIRYVDPDTNMADEKFLGYIALRHQTGAAIAEAILEMIDKLGLDRNKLVGLGFDGAAAMAGAENGAQAHIKGQCPDAAYFHCESHCLNLVVRATCNAIKEAKATHTAIQNVCNYFAHSAKRTQQYVEFVNAAELESTRKRLVPYAPTRFVNSHDTVDACIELYEPTVAYFTAEREMSIVNAITDSAFLVTACCLRAILGETRRLSVLLQGKALDIATATGEVQRVVERLAAWRADDEDLQFRECFNSAEGLHCAELQRPRAAQRQQHRNNVHADSTFDYYKRAVWYPLLDKSLEELRTRFNRHAVVAMRIGLLLPTVVVEDPEEAKKAAAKAFEQYHRHVETQHECMVEFDRWQHFCSKLPPAQRDSTTLATVLKSCQASLFPNIRTLFKIFLTLPVTSCSAERAFSVLRMLKTYHRSTMGQDRLNGLALVAVHKDMKVMYDEIVAEYARAYSTRISLYE